MSDCLASNGQELGLERLQLIGASHLTNIPRGRNRTASGSIACRIGLSRDRIDTQLIGSRLGFSQGSAKTLSARCTGVSGPQSQKAVEALPVSTAYLCSLGSRSSFRIAPQSVTGSDIGLAQYTPQGHQKYLGPATRTSRSRE